MTQQEEYEFLILKEMATYKDGLSEKMVYQLFNDVVGMPNEADHMYDAMRDEGLVTRLTDMGDIINDDGEYETYPWPYFITSKGRLKLWDFEKTIRQENSTTTLNKWTIIAAIAGVIAAITGLYAIWLAYHPPH